MEIFLCGFVHSFYLTWNFIFVKTFLPKRMIIKHKKQTCVCWCYSSTLFLNIHTNFNYAIKSAASALYLSETRYKVFAKIDTELSLALCLAKHIHCLTASNFSFPFWSRDKCAVLIVLFYMTKWHTFSRFIWSIFSRKFKKREKRESSNMYVEPSL